MNRIERNKKALIGLSIGIIVLGVIFQAVGIMLTVFGGRGLAQTGAKAGAIVELVFGIIMILLGPVGVCFGIVTTWTGSALKATQGSIAEDNLGKGTVNMRKCQICGEEISGDDSFCPVCGNSLAGKKTCPNCGAEVGVHDRNCTKCGKEL